MTLKRQLEALNRAELRWAVRQRQPLSSAQIARLVAFDRKRRELTARIVERAR